MTAAHFVALDFGGLRGISSPHVFFLSSFNSETGRQQLRLYVGNKPRLTRTERAINSSESSENEALRDLVLFDTAQNSLV